MADELKTFVDGLISWVANTGVSIVLKVIAALVIMFVSFKVINRVARKIEKRSEKKSYDKTIMRTLAYVVKIAAKCLVTVCLIGFVGIDTSGITALIASLGVCFGLAVNGAVANIAGGVLIIVTRPFKIDDYIEAQGFGGTVEEIHMTYTKLRTPDNKIVFIPNGELSNGNIVNYSIKETRRLDQTYSVSYDKPEDVAKAKAVISAICEAHELILKDPAYAVRVSSYGDHGIDIQVRVWTKSSDYWTVHFELLDIIKNAFDENGIEIPYNQLDVHIKNN